MLIDYFRDILASSLRIPRTRRAPLRFSIGDFGPLEQLEQRWLLSTTGAQVAVVTGSAPTNTVVASSADPAVVGQGVTFTVAVAPASSNSSVPTGTITLTIDGANQSAVTLVNGLATMTLSTLSTRTHSITAAYGGDSTFAPSTSPAFNQIITASFATPWVQTGAINVTQYGVIGDGLTDNTAALQNLVNSIPAGVLNANYSAGGVLFYFPAGTYVVSNTIEFSRLKAFGIIGDVTSAGQPASKITSSTPNMTVVSADYINNANHVGTFQIENMQFAASTNGGTGFYASNTENASFQNCMFSGYIGLNDQSPFEVAIRSSMFLGSTGSNIGLFTSGATADLVANCDFSGWAEGIRASGTGLSIIGSTFEHNGVGARLGADAQGNNFGLTRSSVQNLTFTDNSTALSLQSVGFDVFSNISIQGTANAPSGQSQYGLNIAYMQSATLSGIHIYGGFSKAAVSLYNGNNSTFYSTNVSNSVSNAAIWYSAPGLTGLPVTQVTVNRAAQPVTTISVLGSSLLQPVNVDDVTATQVVAGPQNLVLNVTQYGILGDNSTDDTAALQALINAATAGTTFYFPSGVYRVSSTLDLSRLSSFNILGDVAGMGGTMLGSTLCGNFAAPLLKADYGSGAGTFHISNINLRSGDTALYARNAVLSSIQNVQVNGNRGIYLENPFKVVLSSLEFSGNTIGAVINGGYGCTLESTDFMDCNEALRVGGATNFALFASRFEVSNIGINLGIDPSGATSTVVGASIQGISEEANDYAIICASCTNSLFAAIGTYGSSNAPAGWSITGMQVQSAPGSTFASLGIGGAYTGPALRVLSTASNLYFANNAAWNGMSTGTIGPYTPTVNWLATNSAQPVIKGTWDSAGATQLQVTVNGTTYKLGTNSQLTSDAAGDWTLALGANLPNGSYNVQVHTVDAAGNAGDDSTATDLIVNTAAPAPFLFTGEYAVSTMGSTVRSMASIVQSGNGTPLTLNGSTTATATVMNATQLQIGGVNATYANSTITFGSTGTFANQVWTKLDLPSSFTSSLGGTTRVIQNGANNLIFVNNRGLTSPGSWISPTQIVATGFGRQTGTFKNGQLIWSTGEVWTANLTLQGTKSGTGKTSLSIGSVITVSDYAVGTRTAHVVQTGTSTLIFISETGNIVLGKWINATQAVVSVWGNDVATFSAGKINWSDGSVWTQTTTAPPQVTVTDYAQSGGTTHVIQNGTSVLAFVNENGNVVMGKWISPMRAVVAAWGNDVATFTGYNGQINWSDGSIWKQNGPQAVPVTIIDYVNPRNGNTTHVVQNSTGNVTFVNEGGSVVLGKMNNPTQATVAAWGNIVATFSAGKINWSDGSVWNQTGSPSSKLILTSFINVNNGLNSNLVRNTSTTGVFVNEFGSMVLGIFSSSTKATIAAWGNDVATFSSGKINWSDGSIWNQVTTATPLVLKLTDTNGAISTVQLLSATTLIARTGPLQGVTGTRANGKIVWKNGVVWDNFEFNGLNASFQMAVGYP